MKNPPETRAALLRIPWNRILVALAAAVAAAWGVGFVAGLIVRFVAGA